MKNRKHGEFYVFGAEVTWAAFPVLAVLLLQYLPALTGLAITYVIAFLFFLGTAMYRGTLKEFRNAGAFKEAVIAAVLLACTFTLIFLGLEHTTPANAALIGLLDFFFSLIFFNVIRREKITSLEVVGSLFMMVGAAIVFLPGFLENGTFNRGDILIASAMVITPFIHFYQRRARETASGELVLMIRTGIGIPVLFTFAYIFGENVDINTEQLGTLIFLLLINGLVIFGISKLWWLEALHRLPVTKAIALASGAPLITMLFAYLILEQAPTLFQLTAFFPLALGVLLLTRKSPLA